MKEYYIWESRCPDNHFRDPMQREQIIVAASHIDDALEILRWNRISVSKMPSLFPPKDTITEDSVPIYLFSGTRPITDESINYADFVEYESDVNQQDTTLHCIHGKYNENVIIQRQVNCPLVA